MHEKVCWIFYLVFLFISTFAMESKELSPIIKDTLKSVLENESKSPVLIGISGCSGVGKTYFSEMLATLLKARGVHCKILEEDDFKDPEHHEAICYHPHFDYRLFHSFILDIKKGKKNLSKPKWNPWESRPPDKAVEQYSLEEVEVLLINGEFVLCADTPYDFRRHLKLGIFIDACDNDIINWDWERDRDDLQKTQKKDVFAKNKKRDLEGYRAYLKTMPYLFDYLLIKNKNHQLKLTGYKH